MRIIERDGGLFPSIDAWVSGAKSFYSQREWYVPNVLIVRSVQLAATTCRALYLLRLGRWLLRLHWHTQPFRWRAVEIVGRQVKCLKMATQ